MARPTKFHDPVKVSVYMERRVKERLAKIANARGMYLTQYMLYAALETAATHTWIEDFMADPGEASELTETKRGAYNDLKALRQTDRKLDHRKH